MKYLRASNGNLVLIFPVSHLDKKVKDHCFDCREPLSPESEYYLGIHIFDESGPFLLNDTVRICNRCYSKGKEM